MCQTTALTEHQAMEAYWRVEVQLHAVLNSALDSGEWSVQGPAALPPRKMPLVPIG
jgi:hypothetical protein